MPPRNADPARELSLEFAARPQAPRLARDAARELIRSDRFSARSQGELALVVSELVTNAVIHGRGRVGLHLELQGAVIAGEVHDQGPGFFPPLPGLRDGPGGRGLELVSAMTRRWGVHPGISHVWFELDLV